MADEYLKILSSIAPDKARMVDKRNTNFMSLGPLHALFPNARVIHCRRHPIDNCLSLYTTLFRGYAPGYTHTKENLAFYYRQYDRLMKHWISVLPADRVLEIEYEALVSDPERTIRALVEFCGVEWDERCLEHEQNQRLVLTPSLWQVRQPIYKTSVERWRRYEPWLGPLKDLMPAKS